MRTRAFEAVPRLAACALVAGLHSPAEAQHLLPTGAELQINSFTPTDQSWPAIAADGDGDFVVVWSSLQDGSTYGVFGRRWSSAGVAQAVEFQVNSFTESVQIRPAVASTDDGRFVVAWNSQYQDGEASGVFARRFSADGTPQAAEFQVNTQTAFYQELPALAAGPDGEFVITWASFNQDGFAASVFGRRFNSAGVALAVEFQVNTYTDSHQYQVAVSSDDDGDFVIVWTSNYQDGDSLGVFGRRFDSAGSLLATEFQVNSYTSGSQSKPVVAHDGTGRFVISWTSVGQDGYQSGVFARRFDSTGAAQGAEFQVNSYTARLQETPRLAFDGTGDLVVVWHGYGVSGSGEVFARGFASSGMTNSADFQVNSTIANDQRYAVVASTGSFVVAWVSGYQDGSSTGVFARRLEVSALPTLDLDGNGSLSPLTDGLLFLRHLFGFTGTTLTGGAVGAGCTRCDGSAIAAYVLGQGLALDIDGNVALQPLSDGLLVLRYLFGFTGTALTTGAVGAGCSRCDAAAIVPYLQTLD